jgi:hypothetical protein
MFPPCRTAHAARVCADFFAATISAFSTRSFVSREGSEGSFKRNFDAEKIANAVRDKTVRMYGKTTAQRALVDAFGAEVGNAVFFGKIKNPK